MRYRKNTVEWLTEKYVDKTANCWVWTGAVARNGYSKTFFNWRHVSAHRLFYQELVGPIPEGMQIDHLCRNRLCVNPVHLEVVTPRENTLRSQGIAALNAKKVICIRGHDLSGENLYVTPDGRRQCRVCRNQSSAAAYQRRA